MENTSRFCVPIIEWIEDLRLLIQPIRSTKLWEQPQVTELFNSLDLALPYHWLLSVTSSPEKNVNPAARKPSSTSPSLVRLSGYGVIWRFYTVGNISKCYLLPEFWSLPISGCQTKKERLSQSLSDRGLVERGRIW